MKTQFAFVLVLLTFASANLSNLTKILINQKLEQYSMMLQNNSDSMAIDFINKLNYKSCTYFSACNDTLTGSIYPVTNYTVDPRFNNSLVNTNNVLVKTPLGTTNNPDVLNNICVAQNQMAVWKKNLDANFTGLTWQYYGSSTDVFVGYPTFNWGTCPTDNAKDYKPTRRPWYVSGATGQKNLLILIDNSNPDTGAKSRLDIIKQSVILLLNTLAYRDFVQVVTFANYIDTFGGFTMIKATSDNIELLVKHTKNITINTNGKTNIGVALVETFKFFTESINSGYTSLCTNTMVIYSTGTNYNSIVSPSAIVNDFIGANNKITIFSNVFPNTTTTMLPSLNVLGIISCATKGITTVITDQTTSDNSVDVYNNYISSGVETNIVRWSEPYEDAFGMGKMITGCKAIYDNTDGIKKVTGMTCADIVLSEFYNIDNTTTETDLTNHLIQNQQCSAFNLGDNVIARMRKELTCNKFGIDSGVSKTEAERLYPLEVFGAIVIALIFMLSPILLFKKYRQAGWEWECGAKDGFCKDLLKTFSIIAFGVLMIVSLCYMFSNLFDQIVKHENWKAATLVAEKIEENPYRCCDLINCQCTESHSNTCSNLLQGLLEGECNNGYYCCSKRCYSCNCVYVSNKYGGTMRCSTCCDCASSVNNRKCETACGTCNKPIITYSYKDIDGQLVRSQLIASCSRNDKNCVSSFFGKYLPVGSEHPIYYNVHNPNEITESIDYNMYDLLGVLVPAGIAGLIFLAILILFCVSCIPSDNVKSANNTNDVNHNESSPNTINVASAVELNATELN